MSGLTVLIQRENEQLADRLRTTSTAGELCALEAAGNAPAERDRRRSLVRDALSAGLDPRQIGLTFVVALAECAYELDWGEQFSFWPQIAAILNAPAWDPSGLLAREQCTAAFRSFSEEYGGLQPRGRFAECYTHVSWPLFHAVLPRAAQARMSKLLARATADPRFVIAADGTINDRELTLVLRAFAATSTMPAYFDGILQHPTLGGRLGASLIRPTNTSVPDTATLSPTLVERVLQDLREDRVAREQLEEAADEVSRKQERARRRQRAEEEKLDPLLVTFALERSSGGVLAFLEAGPLTPTARDWSPLARVISQNEARIAANVNGTPVPIGYLVNVAYGTVSIGVPWPVGESIGVSIEARSGAGLPVDDQIANYFDRARRSLRLPLVFTREKERDRYILAPSELHAGADVAVVVAKRALRGLESVIASLGMEGIGLPGTADARVIVGRLPKEGPELQSFSRALGLRRGSAQVVLRPSIVPPTRRANDWCEWADQSDAFVEVCAIEPAALRLTFASEGQTPVSLIQAPNGSLIARVPEGVGHLVLTDSDVEVARLRVARSSRAAYREPAARFRVSVMPARASRDEILGEAVWLDVDALPGVHLRIELSATDCREEAMVGAAEATPLHTAAIIATMRRRIERRLGEGTAADFVLSVSNADEPSQPMVVQSFGDSTGPIKFVEENSHGLLRADADADPATLSRLSFGPRGVTEYRQGSVDPISNLSGEGIYLGRVGPASEALAWAAEGTGFPRHAKLELPPRGAQRALDVVRLLRACETATLAPARRMARATIVRNAAVNSLERELVAALCGRRWLQSEETCGRAAHARDTSVEPLIDQLGSLLWVPRSWLQDDFETLVTEWSDPIEGLERACHDGVGDAFSAEDARLARHLFLLFTRSTMASVDDDEECTAWANASVLRPRLVRLFYLTWPTGLERRIQALDETEAEQP